MTAVLLELTPANAGLYLDQLLAIENAAFPEPWSREAYLAELERPIAHIVAVVRGGVLLGYAGFWQVMEVAEVNNVAVAEDFRGQGFGRMLMNGLMDLAELLGCQKVNLELRAANRTALALYQSLGFEPVGRRPGYYEATGEDALLMSCDLAKRIL